MALIREQHHGLCQVNQSFMALISPVHRSFDTRLLLLLLLLLRTLHRAMPIMPFPSRYLQLSSQMCGGRQTTWQIPSTGTNPSPASLAPLCHPLLACCLPMLLPRLLRGLRHSAVPSHSQCCAQQQSSHRLPMSAPAPVPALLLSSAVQPKTAPQTPRRWNMPPRSTRGGGGSWMGLETKASCTGALQWLLGTPHTIRQVSSQYVLCSSSGINSGSTTSDSSGGSSSDSSVAT
jgi:hypothetical protein